MAKLWTDEEIALLKKRYKENKTPKEIAEELNRSDRAVKNKAYILKITNNTHFTDEEIEYIKKHYKRTNLRDIAKKLGREKNYQNVCRAARRLGLTDNKGPKTEHPTPSEIKKRPKYKTKEERINASREFMKKWHKENEHPRGMKGKTHSKEYRERRRKIMKEQWKDPNSHFNSEEYRRKVSERMSKTMVQRIKSGGNTYTNARGGTRKDLGFYVRSRWEANIARYLKYLQKQGKIYKWEYEPDTFWFENIKRGVRSYTPDFKIWDTKSSVPYYWEVKGYMDQKSKTKLKRMAKYYPNEKVIVIGEEQYKEIEKWSKIIPNWEK